MRHKLRLLNLILIVVFIFSFTACTTPKTATETTTAETITVETTTPQTTVAETISPETTIAETTADNKDYELFRNAIKDYDPINKAVEYATTVYEIALDRLEGKIDKEEAGSRYMDLSIQIQKDYMVLGLMGEKVLEDKGISEITPDMIKAIDLINKWADTLQREYEYTAKYYWGEGAEYEIKADELNDDAEDIISEFISLKDIMSEF